jgi:hypothetical protein
MDPQVSGGCEITGLFETSPFFADTVNANIVRSEVEGGVYLADLPAGCALSIETRSRVYEMVVLGNGLALLSGHPEFCPTPTQVHIQGSTWGGSMIKLQFLGRGMRLEYEHPRLRRMLTSRIVDIRVH